MVSVLAILVVLGLVLALMIGGRGHGLRPALANTTVRKATGPNFASMLAVVGIASLILEAASLPVLGEVPGVAPLLVAIAVVLILGVVAARSVTEVILGLLGVGVLILTAGVSGALMLTALVLLMWWLLALVRGFLA